MWIGGAGISMGGEQGRTGLLQRHPLPKFTLLNWTVVYIWMCMKGLSCIAAIPVRCLCKHMRTLGMRWSVKCPFATAGKRDGE